MPSKRIQFASTFAIPKMRGYFQMPMPPNNDEQYLRLILNALAADTEGESQEDHSRRRRDRLTFRGNVKQGRHGWLRLTPAYSLHVVREILEERSPNEFVLDPFSGTGTTPLAAAVLGLRAHAVDVNPFLVWLGNVKTSRLDASMPAELLRAARAIVSRLRRQTPRGTPWIPPLHQIEKWWDAPVLESLSRVFESIGVLERDLSTFVPDLLRIAFCRTMIETANVSFGHQSMSFKKQATTDHRVLFDVAEFREEGSDVYHGFLAAAQAIADSLQDDQPLAAAEVFLGDSRCLDKALTGRGYTKVVTSPPYPNRMSYIRELRPYMYWLGYLSNGRQAGDLDWQAIGGTWGCATSNLAKWSPPDDAAIPYPRFDRIVAAIRSSHDLLGRYVHKYFADIKTHLASLNRVMAPGGKCYYVVGNSKFYDTILPVEEIYAALLDDLGFGRVQIERLRKRTSKKELYEFVVRAEKQKVPEAAKGAGGRS